MESLARQYINAPGQVDTSDAYFKLSGLTYSTSVIGTLGTNY